MKLLVFAAILIVAAARPADDYMEDVVYAESRPIYSADGSQGFGHKMEIDTSGPHGNGNLKVEETHVVMNRRLHPDEAHSHMEKLIGSMGNMRSDFHDFVRGLGF
ncbi:uncharacterized protein [Centruroides vittatus]|uniref:uncharacterized protein n=1 Tax=Centruroides vittatus TaxID=120091 RepID=UPI00350EBB17